MAPPASVRAAAWRRVLPDRTTETIEGHVRDWDPGTALCVTRSVEFDIASIRRTCRLLAGDRVAAVAQWHSLRTALRGSGKAVALGATDGEIEVSVEVPAGLSGGMLVLRTIVVLDVAEQGERSPLVAGTRGAILWQDRQSVALEGKGARFPVEVRKFDGLYPRGAGWVLDWRPGSLENLFMGSVRLLLNEGHTAVVEAATAANPSAAQKHIVSAIYSDVARSLMSGALRSPEFLAAASEFEEGTVGQVVADLIASTFQGEDFETVRNRLESEPELFAARVQERFGLFAA